MALMPYLAWAGLLICAGMSFFFALAESALFSLAKWQVRQLAEHARDTGVLVERLLAEPQHLLATIVLGNTVANAAIVAISLWTAWGHAMLALLLPALFVLLLVGCEMIPKTLAVRAPEPWALRVAGPMYFLQGFTGPLQRLAQRIDSLILSALVPKAAQPQSALSNEEYQELLELAYQQGTLAQSEKEIILQIIGLDRQTARDVMRPRSRMDAIPDDLSLDEMLAAARRLRHSRLPMYDETLDTIVGVLNARALLLDPAMDLADAIEFPSFVPESMNLMQLLKSLQRQQRGLAIVLDEFGGTAGIVTMQDILERNGRRNPRRGRNRGFRHGKTQGRPLARRTAQCGSRTFAANIPPWAKSRTLDTMAGLMLRQCETVPAVGETVPFRGLKLTALAGDERRVRELCVETVPKPGAKP